MREIVTSENRDEYMAKKLGLKKEHESSKELSDRYEKEGIKNDIYNGKHGYELSKIIVPKEKRGQGIGNKFMQELTAIADKENKRIFLTPSTDFGASSVARLKDFYKQHGFVENKGKHKDFSISHAMYRTPKEKIDKQ
jgi:predicted GNAT family N-acyltransferase